MAERSPRWSAVRATHLSANPTCAACGARERLEVHHVRPFHLYPALELVPTNLVTLCEGPGRNCHLTFGHLLSWSAWNPRVRRDAAAYRRKVLGRRTGVAT